MDAGSTGFLRAPSSVLGARVHDLDQPPLQPGFSEPHSKIKEARPMVLGFEVQGFGVCLHESMSLKAHLNPKLLSPKPKP